MVLFYNKQYGFGIVLKEGIDLKTVIRLWIIPFAFLMVFCGCAKQADKPFTALGHSYEECDKSWHPYGDTTEKENFLIYGNDESNIFISESSALSSGRTSYHRVDDVYPSVSQADRIELIVLTNGEKEITLDKRFITPMAEILTFAKIDSSSIRMLDYSKEFYFVNVYYKGYPAYQNEWMISVSDGGNLLIAFCETEKNTRMIGDGKGLVINNDELAKYLKSVLR